MKIILSKADVMKLLEIIDDSDLSIEVDDQDAVNEILKEPLKQRLYSAKHMSPMPEEDPMDEDEVEERPNFFDKFD